jgi:hypothetical protein
MIYTIVTRLKERRGISRGPPGGFLISDFGFRGGGGALSARRQGLFAQGIAAEFGSVSGRIGAESPVFASRRRAKMRPYQLSALLPANEPGTRIPDRKRKYENRSGDRLLDGNNRMG